MAGSGSSPRTWGTRNTTGGPVPGIRFIPTYMGNAWTDCCRNKPGSVHPHVHGERCSPKSASSSCCGSSPRTWGTRPRCPRGLSRTAVHPHVHGERDNGIEIHITDIGSSPRTWGTPGTVPAGSARSRFIPTYMGNAHVLLNLKEVPTVHPHVHGERVMRINPHAKPTGSSPRTWGTRALTVSRCAGCTVHPHVHGERSPRRSLPAACAGSSPRTWGTRDRRPFEDLLLRFIPTYMGNASRGNTCRWRYPVHPHVHGERNCLWWSEFLFFGSSPRTWGTHEDHERRPIEHRFIPTYMGNAPARSRPSARRTVHPHVHGERMNSTGRCSRVTGSSPRTWGTHKVPVAGDSTHRFIPTYMGNAPNREMRLSATAVHPHVHGERWRGRPIDYWNFGSSPRTWGTRGVARRYTRPRRFIPTYMGNAPRSRNSRRTSPVHPHVHGERYTLRRSCSGSAGSSPRTWGTREAFNDRHAFQRFIPTYMGNAPEGILMWQILSVHPHVHGERRRQYRLRGDIGGSSPRTWGTLQKPFSLRLHRRFIPTYMGNARRGDRRRIPRTVHPHVHGERIIATMRSKTDYGSSPRTWGTLGVPDEAESWIRFIPTYMGNAGEWS